MWIVLMELMKTSVIVKSICSVILINMEIIAWMFPIFKDGSRPLPKPVPIIVLMPKISNVNLSITTLPKVFVSWMNWTLDRLGNWKQTEIGITTNWNLNLRTANNIWNVAMGNVCSLNKFAMENTIAEVVTEKVLYHSSEIKGYAWWNELAKHNSKYPHSCFFSFRATLFFSLDPNE